LKLIEERLATMDSFYKPDINDLRVQIIPTQIIGPEETIFQIKL
jgi:hypothetical protein